MMGMGEPLANFDNVVPALRLMLDDNAYGLSRRRVTLSTSGLVPLIDRLREECPVALAVSLHAPNDALRDRLVPINRKYPLAELLAACLRYLAAAPRDFVTFEYVMLDGVNDSAAHARELVGARARRAVQVQPHPVQSVPGHRVPDEPARAHRRVPEAAAGRRPRRRRSARPAATTSPPPAASSPDRSRTEPSAGSPRASCRSPHPDQRTP